MIRLTLRHNRGLAWRSLDRNGGRIYYKGPPWGLDAPLRQWLNGDQDLEQLGLMLETMPYSFAVVYEGAGKLFAATDQIRTQPLFYRHDGSELHLTDDPYSPELGLPLRPDAALPLAEFQLSGYTGHDDTLCASLRSLAARHALTAIETDSGLKVEVEAYRPPIQGEPLVDGDTGSAIRLLHEASKVVFEELVTGLAGRQVVLPLSSGFDSRYIATMLKRHGHDQVFCYTYGRPGSWELKTSRDTAERLGYAWHFIPYTRRMWRERYASAEMQAYLPFAARHVATPHVQDWPAVEQLTRTGKVDPDAVFIPGHTCVLISNRLERRVLALPAAEWRRALAEDLYRHHFILQRTRRVIRERSPIIARIQAALPAGYDRDPHTLLNAYFNFEATERHGKMLVNSVRVYEFWGHEWALPLWDGRLIEAWARVPYGGRLFKSAFKEMLYRTDDYGLFPRPRRSSDYARYRQKVKDTPWLYRPLKRVKCAEQRFFGYFQDYFEWYGIVSYPRYVYHMGRCGDVYSLLSRLYLASLEQDNE